jgi:hypothetical protein
MKMRGSRLQQCSVFLIYFSKMKQKQLTTQRGQIPGMA